MKFTHLDLFSGIGGFSLALESEGFNTIGFSEIDPYASCVLKKHWPTVTNYGDVRNIPALGCDIVTGGFPCQPFSVAGKRRGSEDDRHLWPEVLRVIERCRPRYFIGENVPGIISMELDGVLSDLENQGYTARTFVIPACAVDAKHKRDRVWIVAHTGSTGRKPGSAWNEGIDQPILGEGSSTISQQPSPPFASMADRCGVECGTGIAPAGPGIETANSGEDVANTHLAGSQGWYGSELSECSGEWIAWSGDSRSEQPYAWLPEPGLGRVANGVPNRPHRLRCLGNSIVPQIAKIFARAIYQTLTAQ